MCCWLWLWSLLGCGGGCSGEPAAESPEAPVDEVAVSPGWQVLLPAERDPRWAAALCNDGTPAGVSVRLQPGATDWVVHVQGGFFCNDQGIPCAQRSGRLTTGPRENGQRIGDGGAWHPDAAKGLMSVNPRENPTFHGANHVMLHYCSSDFWLGESMERQQTSGSPEGWYFSGRHVLRAGLESLETVGLDQSDADTRILMVGVSAGGLGLVANHDTLQEVWPDASSQGRVRAVLDAGWIPDVVAPDEPKADRWGVPLKACVAVQQQAGRPVLDCMRGPVWWPYWQAGPIPLLVQQAGVDKSQARVYNLRTSEQRAVWRADMRRSLQDVPWVFSAGGAYHSLSADPRANAGPPGERFLELVGEFWRDEPPRQVFTRYQVDP